MIVLATTALVAASIVGQVGESEALPTLWSGIACAKDFIVKTIREKIISKSSLIGEYNSTMNAVRQRYQEAEERDELAEKGAQERENFYYEITVEELRKLRQRIESGGIVEQEAELGTDAKQSLDKCYDPDALVEKWSPDKEDEEADGEERGLLAEQLGQLERMDASGEDVMGWLFDARSARINQESLKGGPGRPDGERSAPDCACSERFLSDWQQAGAGVVSAASECQTEAGRLPHELHPGPGLFADGPRDRRQTGAQPGAQTLVQDKRTSDVACKGLRRAGMESSFLGRGLQTR